MDTLQTQFLGLRRRGYNEKEDQGAAVRALNCDLYRQILEPRPGREPYIGGDRDDADNTRLVGGGLHLDGDSVWCHVIPDDAIGLNNYIIALVWRYDERVGEWTANQTGTLAAYLDSSQAVEFELYVEEGSPYTLNATVKQASGLQTLSVDLPSLADGDVLRIAVYLERDAPSAGDTTLRLSFYLNGSTTEHANSDDVVYSSDANQGLSASGRWSLGARAWYDPTDDHNEQSRWIEGAIADFIVWSGTSSAMDTLWADTTWFWAVWGIPYAEYDPSPKHHITFDQMTGWEVPDWGANNGKAFCMPLPVLEGNESTNRLEFHSYNYGKINVPIQEGTISGGTLVVAGKFVVPQGTTASADPGTFVGIIAATDAWALILTHRSVGYSLALRFIDPTNAGSSPHRRVNWAYAPSSNYLSEGSEYKFAVAVERIGTTAQAHIWVEDSTTAWQSGSTGASAVVWSPETTVWVGGLPVAGQLSGLYTIITRFAIAMAHDDPAAAGFGGSFVDDMLEDYSNVPVIAKWIPDYDGEFTREGYDNVTSPAVSTQAGLKSVWSPARRSVLEVRDMLGQELKMDCAHKEPPGLSTIVPYLYPALANKVRGLASYRDRAGEYRAAVLTDSGIEVWDGSTLTRPINATSCRLYEDIVPVQAKSFRQRVFFFGNSATRQKFDGEASSAIGLNAPYLYELAGDEDTTHAGEVNSGDFPDDIMWFKVSLYNSRTGQESNLSNPLGWEFTTKSTDMQVLLSLRLAFRDGDDFDMVGVWLSNAEDGEYYLVTRARRPSWRGKVSTGWLYFGDLSTVNLADYRIPITLDYSDDVVNQETESADNHPPSECLIGEFHENRLYLVPRDDPDIVIYSKPHLVESFPALNFARVGERAGDEIRGLISTPVGLLVCTRRETWLIARGTEDNPSPERVSREAGLLSPATVAQSDLATLWLSERGVEGFSGGGLQLISAGIRDVFENHTLSELRTAQAAVWRKRQQYWLIIGEALYILNLQTGEWTEGVIGASWIGDGAYEENAKEILATGWAGRVYKHVEGRRIDGGGWGTSTMDNERYGEVPGGDAGLHLVYSDGYVRAFIVGSEEIDSSILPVVGFACMGAKLQDDPTIHPFTVTRYIDMGGSYHQYTLATPFAIDSFTDGYLIMYIPFLYESHRITVEGPNLQKRIRSVRLHLDSDSDAAAVLHARFKADDSLTGTGYDLTRGDYGRLSSQRVDVTLHQLCRNWAIRLSNAGSTWPAVSFLEWYYSLRKAPR